MPMPWEILLVTFDLFKMPFSFKKEAIFTLSRRYFSIQWWICNFLFSVLQVWASKWNERAYFSTRKVKLDHDYLCMAVLVQEIINADYAFVIHTTNPSSGDSSEIYAEVASDQLSFRHTNGF